MWALKSSPENTSRGPINAKPNIKNPNKPTTVFFINSVLLIDFKYNLIADDSKELIKAFGVWGKKKLYGKEYFGVIRTTFIINEEGKVERVIEKVKTKEHSSQILED